MKRYGMMVCIQITGLQKVITVSCSSRQGKSILPAMLFCKYTIINLKSLLLSKVRPVVSDRYHCIVSVIKPPEPSSCVQGP